jgi:hypothetical protein
MNESAAAGDSAPCSASSPAAASTVSPASKPEPRHRIAISLSKAEAALLEYVPEVGLDSLSWSEETHTVIFRCPCKSHQSPNYVVLRQSQALKDHAKGTAHKLCKILLTHPPLSNPCCETHIEQSVCSCRFPPVRDGQLSQEATTYRGAVSGPRRFCHVKWWLMHTVHSLAGGSVQSRHTG